MGDTSRVYIATVASTVHLCRIELDQLSIELSSINQELFNLEIELNSHKIDGDEFDKRLAAAERRAALVQQKFTET